MLLHGTLRAGADASQRRRTLGRLCANHPVLVRSDGFSVVSGKLRIPVPDRPFHPDFFHAVSFRRCRPLRPSLRLRGLNGIGRERRTNGPKTGLVLLIFHQKILILIEFNLDYSKIVAKDTYPSENI
jgi:hypothetical protein